MCEIKCFIIADGLLGPDNVSRPEHLDDLLSIHKPSSGARPKTPKQQAGNKKAQSTGKQDQRQKERQRQGPSNQ